MAVRAVVMENDRMLLVHSGKKGDYKFPGGGVNGNEGHAEALAREVKEETGYSVKRVGRLIGRITEHDHPQEAGYDVFEMTSYYYFVEVTKAQATQALDQYEDDLGFTPVWVGLGEAIANNERMLSAVGHSRWVARETMALRGLQRNGFDARTMV